MVEMSTHSVSTLPLSWNQQHEGTKDTLLVWMVFWGSTINCSVYTDVHRRNGTPKNSMPTVAPLQSRESPCTWTGGVPPVLHGAKQQACRVGKDWQYQLPWPHQGRSQRLLCLLPRKIREWLGCFNKGKAFRQCRLRLFMYPRGWSRETLH